MTVLRQTAEKTRLRIQSEVLPLHSEFDKLRARLVRLLDRAYTLGTYANSRT